MHKSLYLLDKTHLLHKFNLLDFYIDKRTYVRYHLITNKRSEDEEMERSVDTKMSLFSQLVNNPSYSINKNHIRIYPQMPSKQIKHYIKIANRKDLQVIVQLKPSTHLKQFVEVSGKISLSPNTSHIILIPQDDQTIHLIQAKHIHHLRLA